jgi:hypothetical protein
MYRWQTALGLATIYYKTEALTGFLSEQMDSHSVQPASLFRCILLTGTSASKLEQRTRTERKSVATTLLKDVDRKSVTG